MASGRRRGFQVALFVAAVFALLAAAMMTTLGGALLELLNVDSPSEVVRQRFFWYAVVAAVAGAALMGLYALLSSSALPLKGEVGDNPEPQLYEPAISPRQDAAGRGLRLASQDGNYFTGRKRALAEIGEWLADPHGSRALVVTGTAGMGKSAIVGRVAFLAATGWKVPFGEEGPKWSGRVINLDAANFTPLGLAQAIATKVAGITIGATDELDGALKIARASVTEQVLVVVDSVDETPAHQGVQTARQVLRRLAGMPASAGIRLLVGTRPDHHGDHLIRPMTGAAVVDLRDEKYFDVEDVIRFATKLLQRDRADNPYRNQKIATPVAKAIAERAQRIFLIAQIVAYDLGLNSTVAVDPAHLEMPPDLATALAEYVDRCSDLGTLRARDVLKALAYAESPGLPANLWSAVLGEMTGQHVNSRQLAMYAENMIGDYLISTHESDGGRVYWLFHQALNDTLVADDKDGRVRDNAAFADALLAYGYAQGWESAPPYLLRSLGSHATDGLRGAALLQLLNATDYLLYADLPTLHAALSGMEGDAPRAISALLGTTRDAANLQPEGRAAAFSVTAALQAQVDLQVHFAALAQQHHAMYSATWARVRPEGAMDHVLEVQTGWVYSVATLPDGRIVSGGGDGAVRVCDLVGGEPLLLGSHAGPVSGVVLLPGGRIVTAGDETVRVWDLAGGDPLILKGHTRRVCGVTVLRDGRILSGDMDGTARVWDLAGDDSLVLPDRIGPNWSVAVLPDGQVVSDDGATVSLWDVRGGARHTLRNENGRVRQVKSGDPLLLRDDDGWVKPAAILPDGRILSDADGTLLVRDLGGGDPVILSGHTGQVSAVAVLPDERIVAGGGDGTLKVWNADGGDPLILVGHTGPVSAVAVLPDGRIVSGGGDGTVRVWNVGRGGPLLPTGRAGSVSALAALADGRIVSGGDDGRVRLWDLEGGDPVVVGRHAGWVTAVEATLDGRIVSGGDDGRVRLWDLEEGGPAAVGYHTGSVSSMMALSDGRIVSGGGETVRVWDPSGGDRLVEWIHTGSVSAVAVLSDGRIVSGGGETVRVWDPSGGDSLALHGHTDSVSGVAVLSDGRIVSGGGETVRVWDLSSRSAECVVRLGDNVQCIVPILGEGTNSLVVALRSGLLVLQFEPPESPASLPL